MKKPKLGPTGNFPNGKLNENDEGGLQIGMRIIDGVFQIHFGAPVAWVGLRPEQAKVMAFNLLDYLKKYEGVQ